MPEGAVYVGRPTKWGNPYTVDEHTSPVYAVNLYREFWENEIDICPDNQMDIDELRGKDLACWCPLDQPCHADVLLELANKDGAGVE